MGNASDVHVAALQRVPLFAELPSDGVRRLALGATEVDVQAGTVLVREGDRGEKFFLILEGSARVERAGQIVSHLAKDQFLGEMSLLDGKPRAATVIMESAGRVLTVSRTVFNSLMESVEFRDTLFAVLCERVRGLQAPRKASEVRSTTTATQLDELYAFGEVYDVLDACETVRTALHRLERHQLISTTDSQEAASYVDAVMSRLRDAMTPQKTPRSVKAI